MRGVLSILRICQLKRGFAALTARRPITAPSVAERRPQIKSTGQSAEGITVGQKLCQVKISKREFFFLLLSYRLGLLQGEEIGPMALMVYRTLVRAGRETLAKVTATEEEGGPPIKAVYDSFDYRSVYDQGKTKKDQFSTFLFTLR